MLQHTGLDDAQLGPRLARLLAPGSPLPAREMVARGLAPLAGAEPWLALYQLWVGTDAALADQAGRTAADLPAHSVVAALVDPHLPAVVLDFMARRRLRSPETLRLLLHHPRVADPTLQILARCAPTPVCEALARNHRRWLVCPAIAVQLVHNPACDRASAHAMLELGAREGLAALTGLRGDALAGSVPEDSPEIAARLAAWMLRATATDPLPDVPDPPDTVLPAAAQHLSPGPASPRTAPTAKPPPRLSPGPASPPLLPSGPAPRPGPPPRVGAPVPRPPTLSARPAPRLSPGPADPNLSPEPAPPDLSPGPAAPPAPPPRPPPNLSSGPATAPPRQGRRLDLTPPRAPTEEDDSDADELDLPIAADWDDAPGLADIPPPAPRSAVPLPETDIPLPPPRPRRPEQRSLFSDALSGAPAPAPATPATHAPPPPRRESHADRVARVLDRRTALTVAMSLLHQLRPADLRRVAAARHLAPTLVAAARRRIGAPPEAHPR